MNLPEVKKGRGRPKGSKNKPRGLENAVRTPMKVLPIQKQDEEAEPESPQEAEKESPQEKVTIEKDPVTGEKRTAQWMNEAARAKKGLTTSLCGLKKLKEIIDLAITMTEKAEGLQDFMDALNGSVNGTTGLIMCDDRNGWMDLGYCKDSCPAKCYKYNTGRWICILLRCSNEKITICDERDGRCPAFDIVMGFAERYTNQCRRISCEAK